MSRPRVVTPASIAEESGFDVEDVIIELVRIGLDYAADPRVPIRASDLRAALRAIGMHPKSDERKKSFWVETLGLSESELDGLLSDFGFVTTLRTRVVPKGSHAKLEAFMQARTGPIVTKPATPVAQRGGEVGWPVSERAKWRSVGQKRVSSYLESSDIRMIHEELERDAEQASDPISPPGVRNDAMLESACDRPHTGSTSDLKYPTVEMAAAALVHSLVNNHPFHNGNKRTALVAMMVFLDRNNHWLRDTVKQADLYLWILEVARHRVLPDELRYEDQADHEVLAMSEWIRRNTRAIERSERAIAWRDLRALLIRDFKCKVEPRPTSNKVAISRTVRTPSRNPLRGFRRDEKHVFIMSVSGDGKEIGMRTVKSLRAQLCLTEEYYVDSAIFYGSVASPDRFIAKYQRLLRDLARV